MTALEERLAIVEEARSWLGTPFHHHARVKGAGVDCINFPAAVYSAVLGQPFDVHSTWKRVTGEQESYPVQWFMHQEKLRDAYLDGLIAQGLVEISGPRKESEPHNPEAFLEAALGPGDLVVAKLGRAFAHSGIIARWPDEILQAESAPYGRGKVAIATSRANWWLSNREWRFFSWKPWHVIA